MEIKCLVIYNNKNYLLNLSGTKFRNLIGALIEKKELSHIVLGNKEEFSFYVFEDNIQLYVPIDNNIQINNLSKILIKTENKRMLNSLNFSKNKKEDIHIIKENLNLNKPQIEIEKCESLKNGNSLKDDDLFILKEIPKNNLSNNETIDNNICKLKKKIHQVNEDYKNFENDFDWSEEDIICLLDYCQVFSKELSYFDISNEFILEDSPFYPNEKIWDQIAINVQESTKKLYNKSDCKLKFLSLRATYKNLSTILVMENTYFRYLKYFEKLKQLIDRKKTNLKQIDVKDHPKKEYLALINQVKIHYASFKGSRNCFWKLIAKNLTTEGITCTNRYCQNLFYKLIKKYLEISKSVSNKDEENIMWPYFEFLKDLKLNFQKTI